MTLERKLEEHLFLDVKIYPATFVRFPIIKTGVTSTEREIRRTSLKTPKHYVDEREVNRKKHSHFVVIFTSVQNASG